MCRHHEAARGDAGLGLAELLVSLALLALISLFILGGVDAGRNLWRGTTGRVEAAEAVQGAQDILRERMEAIFPATQYGGAQPYPFLDGGNTELTFLGPPPAAQSPGALRRYTLHVTAGNDLVLSGQSDLWRNLAPSYHVLPTDEILLRGVQGVVVSYFDGANGNGAWQNTWRRIPHLPALIRLQVRFLRDDRRWWPTFVVHPAATVDSECVLSVALGGCGGRQ